MNVRRDHCNISLLILPLLMRFPISIHIRRYSTVSRNGLRRFFIGSRFPLFTRLLRFPGQRTFHRYALSRLNSTRTTILRHPPLRRFLHIVKIMTGNPRIMLILLSRPIRVVMSLRRIRRHTIRCRRHPFIRRLLMLIPTTRQRLTRNMTHSMIPHFRTRVSIQRQRRRNRQARIITRQGIYSRHTKRLPMVPITIARYLLMERRVNMSFRQRIRPLNRGIIPNTKQFLNTLCIRLMNLMTRNLTRVQIYLRPRLQLPRLIRKIRLMMPSTRVQISMLPFRSLRRLRFSIVTTTIARNTFQTYHRSRVILILNHTLLSNTSKIFPSIAQRPLIRNHRYITPSLRFLGNRQTRFRRTIHRRILSTLLYTNRLSTINLQTYHILRATFNRRLRRQTLYPHRHNTRQNRRLFNLFRNQNNHRLLNHHNMYHRRVNLRGLRVRYLYHQANSSRVLLHRRPFLSTPNLMIPTHTVLI